MQIITQLNKTTFRSCYDQLTRILGTLYTTKNIAYLFILLTFRPPISRRYTCRPIMFICSTNDDCDYLFDLQVRLTML